MAVTGLGGRRLHEIWRDGAEAYLGITVSGWCNGHSTAGLMRPAARRYGRAGAAAVRRFDLARYRLMPKRPATARPGTVRAGADMA
jgi:hypothetical protein